MWERWCLQQLTEKCSYLRDGTLPPHRLVRDRLMDCSPHIIRDRDDVVGYVTVMNNLPDSSWVIHVEGSPSSPGFALASRRTKNETTSRAETLVNMTSRSAVRQQWVHRTDLSELERLPTTTTAAAADAVLSYATIPLPTYHFLFQLTLTFHKQRLRTSSNPHPVLVPLYKISLFNSSVQCHSTLIPNHISRLVSKRDVVVSKSE